MTRSAWGLAVFAIVAALAAAACDRQGPIGPAPLANPTRPTLTVFAAASLKSAMDAATRAYAAAHPGVTFAVSTDSSAALEAKLEQAAVADVFLSADPTNARKLADAHLGDEPVAFAANRLAIVAPSTNPAAIDSPADLARAGVKIVAAGAAVPISGYAAQLVANLAHESGYPPDFAARYAANVVSREDNVGGVLTKVALGEGDAGIVYTTDARATPSVRVIPIPSGANVATTYTGSVILSSPERAAAAGFLSWLAGPPGQGVLEPLGFLPPP